jgi:hypothetical protein
VHPTGLALEVFSLSLVCVDFPSRSTSAAQGHIVIHPIILSFNNSGQVALELEANLTQCSMPIFCDLHDHPTLLPIMLVLSNRDAMKQNHSISILLNAT